jgi:hypothetical protein
VVIGLACALVLLGTARRREPTGRFNPAPVARLAPAGEPTAQSDGPGPKEPTLSAELWAPTVAPGEKPDLDQVRTEANEMMQRGEYEPALQRQIWLHNHSTEINPAMRGVRLSFYLADWVELGRRYPKAKQALMEVRDLKTREFEEGRGYSQLFQDINSINNYLNADDATTALFKRIDKLDPALAGQCIHFARTALVKNHEYELCLGYIPDAQADFERIHSSWDEEVARAGSQRDVQQFRQLADNRFVTSASQLIEILAGAGREAEAESIRAQAALLVDDPRLKSAAAGAAATPPNAGAEPRLDELPPVIVRTFPVGGTREVAPGVIEIRATFSKEMADGSWSWSAAWTDSAPALLGAPRFENDHRTCVIQAKVEPGRTYAYWLNSDRFQNFKDKAGRAAVPYLLIFETKKN